MHTACSPSPERRIVAEEKACSARFPLPVLRSESCIGREICCVQLQNAAVPLSDKIHVTAREASYACRSS